MNGHLGQLSDNPIILIIRILQLFPAKQAVAALYKMLTNLLLGQMEEIK